MIFMNRFSLFILVLFCSLQPSIFGFSKSTGARRNQLSAEPAIVDTMLKNRYFDRLGFSQEEVLSLEQPSKENLDKILEKHLSTITFDNLSQHGLPYTASVDVEKTAKKVLDERRGGFCFELNGLLAELLLELGYVVKRVPAIVHTDDLKFDHMATHLILIVSTPDNPEEEFVVDVGFGEPAVNSLKYELGIVQETPEGMVTRLVKRPDDPQGVILEWKKGDEWLPRLKWDKGHPGQEMSCFQEALGVVLGEESIFHQKLIVCKIDRDQKVSLAGNRLKITSPRFGPDSKSTVEELNSLEAVQKVLRERFHVPGAEMVDLEKSNAANPEIWTQL